MHKPKCDKSVCEDLPQLSEVVDIEAEVCTDKDGGEATCSVESIRLIVCSLCPDKFSNRDDLMVSKISEGVSNLLFKVSPVSRDPSLTVIVRVYGVGRDMLIDERQELLLFSELSDVGFGPPILGRFLNGRVEGYLNCRTMLPCEMNQTEPKDYVSLIALEMVRMHSLDIKSICSNNILWDRLSAWAHEAQKVTFCDDSKKDVLISLDVPMMVKEAQWIESVLKEHDGSLDRNLRQEGFTRVQRRFRNVASTVVFCHFDMCSTNVMCSDEEPERVHLIDYEYSGYCPRGFDMANHWYEHSGFETDFTKAYPSQEVKQHFIEEYFQLRVSDVYHDPNFHSHSDAICKEVERYVAVSDLIWYFWSIIKSGDSQADFDYLDYACTRSRSYKFHKGWVCA